MENTIDIKKLTAEDIGRWVLYWQTGEKGRIKSWTTSIVFVVYKCADNWDDFQNYAAATHPKALQFIETPDEKEV